MAKKTTKKTVSEYWDDIFKDYNILNEIKKNKCYKIKSSTINKYKEARLMTKFDYSKQLPSIFKKNNLGILPITNGEYIIGKYNMFKNISMTNYEEIKPKRMIFPDYFETIDPDNVYSESNALNVALLSGMIKDAVGEDVIETIQGKMRATGFKFEIEGKDGIQNIDVEKPAMEIDGGYEGRENICLIEAKKYLPEDFIIRQLYYPYRHWRERVFKNIIPIFFSYDNGIYNFFIYEFKDRKRYNSLDLQSIKRFYISSRESEALKRKIFDEIELVKDLPQKSIPFPQANSFTKVLGILELDEDEMNAKYISELYEFNIRQGSYYLAASRYLELIDGSNGKYSFTVQGDALRYLDVKDRNKFLIKQILKHKVFYYAYKYYLEKGEIPNKEYIINLMHKYTDIPMLNKNGENNRTNERRANSVRGWIQWIIGCQL